MSTASIAEVAGAGVLLGLGIVAYRRGGSQGAVLLFAVAAILAIHGLGLMHYRPLPGEMAR